MSKSRLFLVACSSGVLLSLAWLELNFAPLMLIAFVPLLWMENILAENKIGGGFSKTAVFRYSYPAFLIWNATTIYWIAYATPFALVLPFFQAALMSLALQLAHWTRKAFNAKGVAGNLFFVVFFLALEYVELHWDLNFPWLNLGNSFAKYPVLVQWYEYTGVGGGSLWIMLCNIAFLYLLQQNLKREKRIQKRKNSFLNTFFCLLIPILPVCLSVVLFVSFKQQKAEPSEVVVIQPNLDPYGSQYDLSPKDVCDIITDLADSKAGKNTDYILCPESCLQDYAWEERIERSPSVAYLRQYSNKYPKAEIIAGMSSRRMLSAGQKTSAAREYPYMKGMYYENCNIAIKIDRDSIMPESQIRHKSVLTPGVEKMPFKQYLGFMERFALDLGGTVGSLGVDEGFVVFTGRDKPKVATAICYESVDGQYIADLTKEGAELLFIITNDGWWKDSPGHRQHAAFARLRAIENRRYVARSANTGISCFIDPRGKVLQHTSYWTREAISQKLVPQKRITFYTRYGDYIYRLSAVTALMSLMLGFVVDRLRRADRLKTIKNHR